MNSCFSIYVDISNIGIIVNLEQFVLTNDERRLFAELSDSGIPLSLTLMEVRSYHPELTEGEQLQITKDVLKSLIDKGLVALCKLTPKNTINYTYEVNDTSTMTLNEINMHISKSISWKQYRDPNDKTISYEISPTDLGEKVLDLIFEVDK